jgi:tetratricopeptide (TPR) repeat protein
VLPDKNQPRRIVPRWRPSALAASSAGFASLKKTEARNARAAEGNGTAFLAFSEDRSLGSASEALSEAILERNAEAAKHVANYVLQNRSNAPAPLVRLASDTLAGHSTAAGVLPPPGIGDVAHWRSLLKLAPKNPAVWADMARHYSSLGDKKQALRCMKTALQLAPDHRWMLRIASRLLVHQEDAAAAHKLLANHPRTKVDPWLMAAELACAHIAGKAPKSWKTANDALKFDRFPAAHISELATAIGMMELEGGQRKQARKLVQRALIAPTENTLAQVLWAKEAKHLGDGIQDLDKLIGARRDAYEAAYRIRLKRGDIQDALKACQQWGSDEPFAARPRVETTFVASLLDDHPLVIRTADEALRIDGKLSYPLELNQLFARLSSGQFPLHDADAVQKTVARLITLIDLGGPVAMHATANLALLQYRSGKVEFGKEFYRKAIDMARKIEGFESAAMAATFAAREAILAGAPGSDVLLAEALHLAERSGSESANFYNRKLQALVVAPDRASLILSPSATKEFLKPMKIIGMAKHQGVFVLTVGRSETSPIFQSKS